MINPMDQQLSYDEYVKQVVDLVFKSLTENESAKTWWRKKVCTDTIPGSYKSGATVADAAVTAENDTCYWDGGFGT